VQVAELHEVAEGCGTVKQVVGTWGHWAMEGAMQLDPAGFVKVPFPMVPVKEPWGILTYMTP